MLDLTYIRQHPDEVKAAMVKLNAAAPIDLILELDAQWRKLLQEVEALRARRNATSKEMGRFQRRLKEASSEERKALQAEFETIRQEMRQLGERIGSCPSSRTISITTWKTTFGSSARPKSPSPICTVTRSWMRINCR